MDIHPERFALSTLVEEAAGHFPAADRGEGPGIRGRAAGRGAGRAFTDKQRLRQILHNLLSNAVKFTERDAWT